MKALWNRITLMNHATEADSGKIPPIEAAFYVACTAVMVWSAWIILTWIVRS